MSDLIVATTGSSDIGIATRQRTPTWGTRSDQVGAVRAGVLAAAAVALYTLTAHRFAPEFVPIFMCGSSPSKRRGTLERME